MLQKQFGNFLNPCTDKISWKCNAERDLKSLILQCFSQNVSKRDHSCNCNTVEKGSLWLLPVARGSSPAVQQKMGEGQRAVWLLPGWMVYVQHVGNRVTLLGNSPTLLPVRKMDQKSFTDFMEENAEPFATLPMPQPLFNVSPCRQHQHGVRQLLGVFYKFWTLTKEVYWWHNCFSLLADFKLAFKLLSVFSWFFLCFPEESCFYTPSFSCARRHI